MAAAMAATLIAVALPAPALAVGCTGAGCIGKEPNANGCSTGAVTLQGIRPPGGGPQVFLRWSSTCVANWARWDDANPGAPGYWTWWVETSDGHREYPLWQNAAWTYMVNGRLWARACIKGLDTDGYSCTNWY
jgi:hypothetical protein